MGRKYTYLPLEKVQEGMRLADDLLDRQGHVLLPSGATLSAHMLQSIGHHGIHQLPIEQPPEPPEAAQRRRTQQIERLDQLFRHTENPAGLALKAQLQRYREESEA